MLSRNIHNNFIIYKLFFHNRHGYLWVCAKCLKKKFIYEYMQNAWKRSYCENYSNKFWALFVWNKLYQMFISTPLGQSNNRFCSLVYNALEWQFHGFYFLLWCCDSRTMSNISLLFFKSSLKNSHGMKWIADGNKTYTGTLDHSWTVVILCYINLE